MKMKWTCVLILLGVLVTCAIAQEIAEASSKQAQIIDGDDDGDDDEDYDYYSLDEKAPHKHKHKHKLAYYLGGLKSLAAFVAIKIKIILIVITVIGIIGFTLKVFGALKYAGYVGGADCPVIHEPAYGLGYSATPPPEHSDYGTYGNDWSSTGSYARALVNNYIDTDFVYRILKKMDMAEMMFSALEIDTDQCKRRMVCEIDAKTRKIPYLDYAMHMFSQGFDKYRTDSVTKFNECAKLYPECTEYKETKNRRKRTAKKILKKRV